MTMLAPLLDQVRDSASQHARLLRDLTLLEGAPSAFDAHKRRLEERRTHASVAEREVDALRRATKDGREGYLSRRNSGLRRLGSVLAGRGERFSERVAQDEHKYLEALEEEVRARRVLEELSVEVLELEKTHDQLAQQAVQYDQLQSELDELYESIFGGPTPEFPEEDILERTARFASAAHRTAAAAARSETDAATALKDAQAKLRLCAAFVGRALAGRKRNDVSWWESVEVDLGSARGLGSLADGQLRKARQAVSAVRVFEPLPLAKAAMSDSRFENLRSERTDTVVRTLITNCMEAARASILQLDDEIQESEVRLASFQDNLSRKTIALTGARNDLRACRQSTFSSILRCEITLQSRPPVPPQATSSSARQRQDRATLPPLYDVDISGSTQRRTDDAEPLPPLYNLANTATTSSQRDDRSLTQPPPYSPIVHFGLAVPPPIQDEASRSESSVQVQYTGGSSGASN